MSNEAQSWVRKCSQATGSDYLVLLNIANEVDSNGRDGWPGQARLAHFSRMSVRSVQRAIDNLKALGELDVQPHAGGKPGWKNRPNLYHIKCPVCGFLCAGHDMTDCRVVDSDNLGHDMTDPAHDTTKADPRHDTTMSYNPFSSSLLKEPLYDKNQIDMDKARGNFQSMRKQLGRG